MNNQRTPKQVGIINDTNRKFESVSLFQYTKLLYQLEQIIIQQYMNYILSPRNLASRQLSVRIIRGDEPQTETPLDRTVGLKQEIDRYLKANLQLEDKLQQEQFKSIDLMMKIQMCQNSCHVEVASLKATISKLEEQISNKSKIDERRASQLVVCHNKINELQQANRILEDQNKTLKHRKQTLIYENVRKLTDSLWLTSNCCESKIKARLEVAEGKIRIMHKTINELRESTKLKIQANPTMNFNQNQSVSVNANVNMGQSICKLLSQFQQKWERLYLKMRICVQSTTKNLKIKQIDQYNESDESTKQDKQISIVDKVSGFNKKYLRLFEQISTYIMNKGVSAKVSNADLLQIENENTKLKQSVDKLQQQNAKTIKYLETSQNFIVMLQKQLQNSYEANKQAEQKARQLEIDVIKTNIICDEDNELIIAKGLAKLNEKYSMIFKYS